MSSRLWWRLNTLAQGQPPTLQGPVQSENAGPLRKKQRKKQNKITDKKAFPFSPQFLYCPFAMLCFFVFCFCYLIPHSQSTGILAGRLQTLGGPRDPAGAPRTHGACARPAPQLPGQGPRGGGGLRRVRPAQTAGLRPLPLPEAGGGERLRAPGL